MTKPALIRLIKTYWDQYLKGHNYFIDQWTKIIPPEEEVWLGLPDMYQLIIDYQYPKLAKVFKIKPVHVVDFLKLAVLSIDGTLATAASTSSTTPPIMWCSTCAAARCFRNTPTRAYTRRRGRG